MIVRYKEYAVTESTNDVARRVGETGAPEGQVVLAFRQSAGRGRVGARWESPFGGMYASILLRPTVPVELWPNVTLVMAQALRRTCGALVGCDEQGIIASAPDSALRIKLPNDIVVVPKDTVTDAQGNMCDAPGEMCEAGNMHAVPDEAPGAGYACDAVPKTSGTFRKLCGINAEAHGACLVVGVGVNVVAPAQPLRIEAAYEPVFLQDLGWERAVAAAAIASKPFAGPAAVQDVVRQVCREVFTAFEPLYDKWNK